MSTPPRELRLVALDGDQFRRRLPQLLDVYATAMGYPASTKAQRAATWLDHIRRPGALAFAVVADAEYDDVAARSANPVALAARRIFGGSAHEEVVALAYGYRGAPNQWWYQQVLDGLRQRNHSAVEAAAELTEYFELTELHVHPAMQGRGIGEHLLRTVADATPQPRILLSTPEISTDSNSAWRLYRRTGFTDVLRNFTFAGDRRPFAVLAANVPLPTTDSPAPWSQS